VFTRVLLASLAARRVRLGLGVLAVTVGVAAAVALAALALESGDDFARTLRAAGPNFVVLPAGAGWGGGPEGAEVRVPRAGATLPVSVVADLKRSFWKNNVLDAAPERTVVGRIAGVPATAVGTWFDHDVASAEGGWRTGLKSLRPHWRIDGRWPTEGATEVVLGRRLASQCALGVGSVADLEIGGGTERVRVSGIVDVGGPEDDQVWMSLERMQAVAVIGGAVDRVWVSALVKPEPPGPVPDQTRDPKGYERYMCTAYPGVIARELSGHLQGAEALPLAEVVAGEAHVVGRLDLLMLLLAAAALGASALGLISTTTATVVERRVELALLATLGASGAQLGILLLCETVLVSLAGGVAGWLVGNLAADVIRGHAWGHVGTLRPLLLPVALLLSLVLALAGTLGPLRLTLRLEPAQVLRG